MKIFGQKKEVLWKRPPKNRKRKTFAKKSL